MGMIPAYASAIFIVAYTGLLDTNLKLFFSLVGLFVIFVFFVIRKICFKITVDFTSEIFEFHMARNGKKYSYKFSEIINVEDSLWLTFETKDQKIYLNSYIGGEGLTNDIARFKKMKCNYK